MTIYHFWPGSIEGLTVEVQVRTCSYKEAYLIVKEFVRRGVNFKPHCRG